MKLTVAVVDDDSRYRASVAHAILSASDLSLVGMADDIEAGRELIDQKRPAVLLVDLGLPGGSGMALIRHAAAHLPECDIMVVTVFGDEEHVLAAVEAGATGYLLKGTRNVDLAEQIRTLHAGGSPVSPVIARRLLTRLAAGTTAPLEATADMLLSPQEHRVLSLTARGHSYDEVARQLGVSRQTVLTYVKRTYRKLQVHSKLDAVRRAQRAGWLRDDAE